MAITRATWQARAHAGIFGKALAQTVKPFGDGLAGMSGQRLRTRVDLDAGDDAHALKRLGKG